jgi:hypothetical protein
MSGNERAATWKIARFQGEEEDCNRQTNKVTQHATEDEAAAGRGAMVVELILIAARADT